MHKKEKYNTSEIKKVLKNLVRILNRFNFNWALIGGVSLDIWGFSRTTYDIDMLVAGKNFDIIKFNENIKKIGGLPDNELSEERMLCYIINGIRVDFLFAIEPFYKEILKRRIKKKCFGITVWTIQLEDLIIAKLRMGRPRDIDDVISLLLINKGKIDIKKIKSKVRKLYLTEEWNIISKYLK